MEDRKKLEQIFSGFRNHHSMENLNDIIRDINSPKWKPDFDPKYELDDKYPVQDWKTYIPEEWQKIWDNFDIETKLVAYSMAEHQASNEEWD